MANVPVGVKVISVLYYIFAALAVISGIAMFFGAGLVGSIPGLPVAMGTGIFVLIGIVMLALAVLAFFIARGLWVAQKWARIVAIILAIIGLISSIMGLFTGVIAANIVWIIIHALIGGYLLFSSQVKAVFK
jgi:hypothetical protein